MTQVLTRPASTPPPTPARHRHAGSGRIERARRLAHRVGYRRAAAGVIAAGCALRIYHWLTSGSFSQDEVSLVINFAHRSFAGLRGGLEYDQMAPIGWLWAEKLAYTLAGPGEASLRFVPLLAGCAALVPVAALARRLLSAPVALVAVGLVAGSPQILYYSTQVKQYSTEVACTALLLVLALRADAQRTARPSPAPTRAERGRILAFWAVAAAAVWFATTSAFTAAGVGGLLILSLAWRARWRWVGWHAVGGAGALASLGALLLVQRPHVAGWVATWWARHYPGSMGPAHLTVFGWLRWTAQCGDALARQALGVLAGEHRVILLALLAAGAVLLVLRRRRPAVVVAVPVVTAYLLGLFRIYPFGARLALWVMPVLLLMVCAVLDALLAAVRDQRLWRWRGPAARWVAGGLAVLATLSLTWAYAPTIGRQLPNNQLTLYARAEEAVRYVATERGPMDQVYFGYNTARAAIWYGPRAGLTWDGTFEEARGRACAAGPGRLAEAPRVWLVLRASERMNPGRLGHFHEVLSRSAVLLREKRFNWIVVAEYRFTSALALPAPVAGAGCYQFIAP